MNAETRPVRRVGEVEQWRMERQAVRWRYGCLVLYGDSMLGKTPYVFSLASAGRSLELNCVSGNGPDIPGHDAIELDFIWLDDMPTRAILQ